MLGQGRSPIWRLRPLNFLEYSHYSVAELRNMVEAQGVRVAARMRRTEVVEQLMFLADQKIDKPINDLLSMSSEELLSYFDRTKPSRAELLRLLETLGFHPGSEAQKSLYKYAARQISETGMFQRVARPNSSGSGVD